MKYLILIIVTVLLSVVNGYGQYRISIDSSFNFGDKERFLKQSTGLSGYVVAAQLNKRGNYLVACNYTTFNHRDDVDVTEISASGELLRVYKQVDENAKQSQTITSFSDMYVDNETGLIYLLAYLPFQGLKTPKREETIVIVLDSNLTEVKRLSLPKRIFGEPLNWMNRTYKFSYSTSTKELLFNQLAFNNGAPHHLFKVNRDSIIQIRNHPFYYFDGEKCTAFAGDKLLALVSRYRNSGHSSYFSLYDPKLSYIRNNELPDTTFSNVLNWEIYYELKQFTPNKVLVSGRSDGSPKLALIDNNFQIDTSSLVISNILNNKLVYIHTEEGNVLLRKSFGYNTDTTFALNNHYWEMNVDGTNLRPSEINWYPSQSNQNKTDDYFDVDPIVGTNKYFARFGESIFLIENDKVNLSFQKKLGPDLTRIYDIQPTLNNQWYVVGNFRFFNGYKTNGIARLNNDGSLDTTFKFSLDKFPFLKNVDSYDRYFFRPKIVSPLINGDLMVAFDNSDFLSKDNRQTFKLDRFGNLKNEFALDGNHVFGFSKVQDFGNGKYLVHRVENQSDNDIFYNLGPYLDINITDTNGKHLNQLLLSRESASVNFHLVKVKILDSTHYLLAYCLQTETQGAFEKGDFYIYKVSTSDQSIVGLTPLYYKKLEAFTYIDLRNDNNWNLKIQDIEDENLFTIIYLDSFGKELYSFKTKEPYAAYFSQIKLIDHVKVSLTNSYQRTSNEWFYLQNEKGDRLQTQSDDFTGMFAVDRGSANYLDKETRIQKITDSTFWFIADRIVFPKDNSSSVSGFFRIKIKETNITSEPDKLNAKVFPNPTNGIASIELPFYYEDGLKGNIMVTDISGKQMYNDSFTLLKYENLQLDFSKYNSGLYFVRVETNGRLYYTKVVKR